MVEIFNTQYLLNIYPDFPVDKLRNLLQRYLNLEKMVNIIFLKPEEMERLNEKYRGKSEVTDVLSFNIDTQELLGEVYICPKYIIKTTDKEYIQKQILRATIHGILHLQGYDHKRKFREVDYTEEPMYIRQEKVLNKVLTELIQK